jgi:hypothetical protein
MWKGEHRGSKTTLGFALHYHSKDCIVVTTSHRDQEILQRTPWFNQVLQSETPLIHSHGRALNG